MIHLGIDHHKKYSVVVGMRDTGEIVLEERIGSRREDVEALRAMLPKDEVVQAVLEAGRNWGPMYDALEDFGFNPKLANPLKVRLIAESFVKTDKIDATVHAMLLRNGITPVVHVPGRQQRQDKQVLRRRLWLVRWQTALKNRIHLLLDRNHVVTPEVKDLFGQHGREWLSQIVLPEIERKMLERDLSLLDTLKEHIRETERWIRQALAHNPLIPVLESFPGIGALLAAVIALEIDTIDRFANPGKLCAYSGLVNSTYSSGGKTRHGRLIPQCNRYLRYAFIEAAWTSARVSPYFREFFKRLKARKGTHDAIGAVARKLCEITWFCLSRQRLYEERLYRYRPVAMLRP
jgi:transposase